MKTLTVKSEITVNIPLTLVFGTFFKFDFLQIFKGLWFVPNFDYLIQNKQEFRPGNTYTIFFDKGSTAALTLQTFLPELSFSGEVNSLSFSWYSGLKSIEYFLYFSENKSNGACRINCEYHFNFRSKLGILFFEFFGRQKIQKNLHEVLLLTAEPMSY